MINKIYHSAVSILLLASFSPASSADAPKAVFSETKFAFGTVRQGTMVEHEFILKNQGEGVLRILGVRATGPLLLGRMPAQIQPGTESTLRVQLDTSKLGGAYQGQMQISLNDPAMSEAVLFVEGRVQPPIELLPHPVFFVGGQRGEPKQASVEIINHEPEPLQIESVEHPAERFKTKVETIEDGQRYRLTLILNPDGPGGKKTENIVIRTSSRTRPSITIPANTYLRERVYTFPDEVDLGTLPLSMIKARPELLQQAAQTLMIYQRGGGDFQVKLRTDLPMLDLKWERGPLGDRYQGTITLIGQKLQPGPIKGTITVETSDPKFPRLSVPVTGSILDR